MQSSSPETPDELSNGEKDKGQLLYAGILDTLFTGIVILIPLIVTIYILSIALDFVYAVLQPVIGLFEWVGIIDRLRSIELARFLIDLGVYRHMVGILTELITLAILLGFIMIVGTIGRNQYGERLVSWVDLAITSIPGLGTVYKSFRRMGDIMLNDNVENFQEVKLVECLEKDMYILGFQTSDSPPSIESATGHEDMVAMFLPLAPNPVTGGFLTYVPEDEVYDIDMTIEEGVRSILTSGIATGERASEMTEMTMGGLEKKTDVQHLQETLTSQNRDYPDESDEQDP